MPFDHPIPGGGFRPPRMDALMPASYTLAHITTPEQRVTDPDLRAFFEQDLHMVRYPSEYRVHGRDRHGIETANLIDRYTFNGRQDRPYTVELNGHHHRFDLPKGEDTQPWVAEHAHAYATWEQAILRALRGSTGPDQAKLAIAEREARAAHVDAAVVMLDEHRPEWRADPHPLVVNLDVTYQGERLEVWLSEAEAYTNPDTRALLLAGDNPGVSVPVVAQYRPEKLPRELPVDQVAVDRVAAMRRGRVWMPVSCTTQLDPVTVERQATALGSEGLRRWEAICERYTPDHEQRLHRMIGPHVPQSNVSETWHAIHLAAEQNPALIDRWEQMDWATSAGLADDQAMVRGLEREYARRGPVHQAPTPVVGAGQSADATCVAPTLDR